MKYKKTAIIVLIVVVALSAYLYFVPQLLGARSMDKIKYKGANYSYLDVNSAKRDLLYDEYDITSNMSKKLVREPVFLHKVYIAGNDDAILIDTPFGYDIYVSENFDWTAARPTR